MSDLANPYESPESAAVPVKPLVSQGSLTETMLIYLKGASPWLRLVGILGFIGSGLLVLWGIVLLIIIPLGGEDWYQVFEIEQLSSSLGGAFGGSMAIFTIGVAVLLFIPSLFAYRFGEKVRSFLRTGTDQDLELAFKNNKSFWKYIGIFSIVSLAFIPLLIVVGIMIAVAVALV